MFVKSIFGGIMIALSSYIYLQVGGVTGAFLFSIGLLTILNMNFKLYTGAIGYVKGSKQEIKEMTIILMGNFIGSCLLLLFPHAAAVPLVASKLALPLSLVLVKAIICGIFMYVAVDCFRKTSIYMVPLCVAGFILFGGEHCIADLCYFIASNSFDIGMLVFFLVALIGNSIGAIIVDKVKIL